MGNNILFLSENRISNNITSNTYLLHIILSLKMKLNPFITHITDFDQYANPNKEWKDSHLNSFTHQNFHLQLKTRQNAVYVPMQIKTT